MVSFLHENRRHILSCESLYVKSCAEKLKATMAGSGASPNAATATASHGPGRHSATAHLQVLGPHLSALLKSLLVLVSLVSFFTHPQGEELCLPACTPEACPMECAPGSQAPDLGRLKGDRAKPCSKHIATDLVQALLITLLLQSSGIQRRKLAA